MSVAAFSSQFSSSQFSTLSGYTLIYGINEVLKRVNVIAGNTGAITSLTSPSIQHNIDIAIQVINEGTDELFSVSHKSLPNEQKEATITLVTGQREYIFPGDFITVIWPFIDKVNNQYIWEYEQGYNDLLLLDPMQTYTGLPIWGAISPITGNLRLDRAPDAPNAGHVYTYQYERDLGLFNANDQFPFNSEVFRAMVPVWAQLYKREMRNEFDQSLYTAALGRAARIVTEEKPRENYSPRR